MLHVAVDDVEAWYEHVTKAFADNALARVARISTRIKDEGYARVFHVWDPSGVLIHFAQFANS